MRHSPAETMLMMGAATRVTENEAVCSAGSGFYFANLAGEGATRRSTRNKPLGGVDAHAALPGGTCYEVAMKHRETARLKRQRREMQAVVNDMIKNAEDVADYVAGETPNRLVSDDEILTVEAGVVAIVLNQTREQMKRDGASEARLKHLDGVAAEVFRGAFSKRFRAQTALAQARTYGGIS